MPSLKNYAVIAIVLMAGLAHAQMLTPVWTEVGERGTIARVVVNSRADCPSISVDGVVSPMTLRRPIPKGLRPACEFQIPATAQAASVAGKALALPHANPSRIVVIGDTGCRIKGAAVQDCNDPVKWPFRTVASQAAKSKSDLVIHVGDYLYREDACPADKHALCGGTPIGDSWETWDADFFAPASELLASTPWAFARGNHEDCQRAWRGWFYYLDPRPFKGKCDAFSAPYIAKLGAFELVMFDSASASTNDPKKLKRYAAQLSRIHAEHAWFVLHHPVWGLRPPGVTDPPGSPALETSTEISSAWEKSPLKGIDLILAGHTHLFELLSFDSGRPPQLIAGDGGTAMGMPLPARIAGLKLRNATLLSAQDAHEFGYTVLTRADGGWRLALTSTAGKVLESATLPLK